MREPLHSEKYGEALAFAAKLHNTQPRKKVHDDEPTIPYVAHLLETSALVWMGGGDEDQAIAALLHDALEDQYTENLPAEIEHRFGSEVLRIVQGCTDGEPGAERGAAGYRERKQTYLNHLATSDDRTLLVSAADKTSNARAIADDLASGRPGIKEMFNTDWAGVLWYYSEIDAIIQHRLSDNPVAMRLHRSVSAMEST